MDEAIKDVNVEISLCSHIEISDDNIIAAVTVDGVHFIELDASAKRKQLIRRRYIRCNTEMPLAKQCPPSTSSPLWGLDVDSVKKAVMFQDTAAIVSKGLPPKSFIICLKFSKRLNGKTLFAALTNHGALDIYQWKANDWEKTFNVAGLWTEFCKNEWALPRSWPTWRDQLEMGKPVAFTWFTCNSQLYLIFSLNSGDIAVCEAKAEPELSLKIVKRLKTDLKYPCSIHAFANAAGRVMLSVGYFSGEVTAMVLALPDWKIIESVCLWLEKDRIAPSSLVSVVSKSSAHLILSKTHFLVIHTFGEVVTTVEKDLNGTIASITAVNDLVFVAMENNKLIKLSLPDLQMEELLEASPKGACQGLAVSLNEALFVTTNAQSMYKSVISVSKKSQLCASAALLQGSREDVPLTDILDLLWLRKVTLVKESVNVKEEHTIAKEKLKYWELHLKVELGRHDETIERELQVVENSLAEAHMLREFRVAEILTPIIRGRSEAESCGLCGAPILSSNVTFVKCAKSHLFPRCTITFEPCITPRYAACTLCNTVATINQKPGFPSYLNHTCPFCDGRYQLENNLVN